MSDAARKDLTDEELASLRQLARVIKLMLELDEPVLKAISERPPQPTAEDFDRVAKIRRRKGLDRG